MEYGVEQKACLFENDFLMMFFIKARVEVLKIHTKEWIPRLPNQLITELAQKAVGKNFK